MYKFVSGAVAIAAGGVLSVASIDILTRTIISKQIDGFSILKRNFIG